MRLCIAYATHQSWAESETTESDPDPDKILLLRMELKLNTGTKCLGMAFILRSRAEV